jgi:ribosomal protein S10
MKLLSLAPVLLAATFTTSSFGTLQFPNGGFDLVGDGEWLGERRRLAIGDFARFNELFSGAELLLVDSINIGENLIKLTISNLVCRNINLGDMQTNYSIFSANGIDTMAYTINIDPFSMTCEGEYRYVMSLGFLPDIEGSGNFVAVADNNAVVTRIDLSGPSTFAQEPPSTAVVNSCDVNINTNGNIEFEGTTFQRLLDLDAVQNLISNLVDDRAKDGTLLRYCYLYSPCLPYCLIAHYPCCDVDETSRSCL